MLMEWLDWPRAPLVLGLVLGRLVENNLFISYARYDLAFLTRPLLIAIILASLAIVLAPLARRWVARRRGMERQVVVAKAG
jgi:TctA family transporter